MGQLEKDIELNTVLPIFGKRIRENEKGETITERVVVEQMDAEGFSVQGHNAPLHLPLLFAGTSPVRTEKNNWKTNYEHCDPKKYREFWYCEDSFKNHVLIFIQNQVVPLILGMFIACVFALLIGNATLSVIVLGSSGLAIITYIMHTTSVVDGVLPYPIKFVEVYKAQDLVRFMNLENIVPAKPYKEDIYKGKKGEKQILIATDVQAYSAGYTDRADVLMEEIERKDIMIAALDGIVRDLGLRRDEISEEEKKEKKSEEVPEEIP